MAHQTSSPTIMDFLQRYQALQAYRVTGDTLIQDLLVYIERVESRLMSENALLRKQVEDANLDLDDARRSRRDLQLQLNSARQMMEQSTTDADSMRNRNPYIQVLIDGDGMIFKEDLIRLGIEGGKQAAATLRTTVLHYCKDIVDLSDETEVIASVYANYQGLSNAMLREGSVDDLEQLKNFLIGFTQAKASFDFVDVGHGKERADSKIKELMRWHLRNHNCKQILLGISHDAGYAPFLDEVVKQDARSRVAIIEGPPTVRELSSMGLEIINFTQIFRNGKLTEKLTNNSSPLPSTWAGVTSIAPSASSPNIAKHSIVDVAIRSVTPTATPTLAADWVPEPRGLDPPVAVNQAALEKLKRRTTSNKLCNNHYLRGPCAKEGCQFEHNYTPNEEELKAIAYMTRLNPCTKGQDCISEYCIYGHHCPSVTWNGKQHICLAFGCRFQPEDHPPGTTIKQPRKNLSYAY